MNHTNPTLVITHYTNVTRNLEFNITMWLIPTIIEGIKHFILLQARSHQYDWYLDLLY